MTLEVSLKGWARRRYLEKRHKSISQRKHGVKADTGPREKLTGICDAQREEVGIRLQRWVGSSQ